MKEDNKTSYGEEGHQDNKTNNEGRTSRQRVGVSTGALLRMGACAQDVVFVKSVSGGVVRVVGVVFKI